jgi:hypothetical protein
MFLSHINAVCVNRTNAFLYESTYLLFHGLFFNSNILKIEIGYEELRVLFDLMILEELLKDIT